MGPTVGGKFLETVGYKLRCRKNIVETLFILNFTIQKFALYNVHI